MTCVCVCVRSCVVFPFIISAYCALCAVYLCQNGVCAQMYTCVWVSTSVCLLLVLLRVSAQWKWV